MMVVVVVQVVTTHFIREFEDIVDITFVPHYCPARSKSFPCLFVYNPRVSRRRGWGAHWHRALQLWLQIGEPNERIDDSIATIVLEESEEKVYSTGSDFENVNSLD